ncbi:MAG: peptide chain release factor 2 [Candidatus Riflebacteria bacterium]|nr:peptide chain release factor 2 [Candidatus Riflebacteria bacterium]
MFDLPKRKRQIEDLENRTLEPNFWSDRNKAQNTTQKIADLRKPCEVYEALERDVRDAVELIELADGDGDTAMLEQMLSQLKGLEKRLDEIQLTLLLSEEYDDSDCYLSIKPGAGGTESCDWASMLYRMYSRWIDRTGFKYEVIDLQDEDHGIKSVTLLVKGRHAYGYLKGEKGVHRLVRISPFDSNARRHTSFAAVDIVPVLPEDADVEIRDDDIKLDFFRSSGAGGQHVNKTSSAVRITHNPSGIVVTCQIERSQHQNREVALRMLKARLFAQQREATANKLKNIQGDQKGINFGSQIRSYVFCPYTLVKDLRTGESTSNVHEVMDGSLDKFVNAYLKWHASGEKPRNQGSDEEEEIDT